MRFTFSVLFSMFLAGAAAAAPTADLRIQKVAAALAGNQASFTITVTNFGPLTEPGPIVISDTLPAGLTYATGPCTSNGQIVTCTISGPLSSGNTISVAFTVNVTTQNATMNCASVTGTGFDPNVNDNRSCTCVPISAPCRPIVIDASTGSDNGLPLPVGASDPEWIVMSAPFGGANNPAFVPQKPAPWLTPTSAAWITAAPPSGTSPPTAAGDYVYNFVFTIPPDLQGGTCVLSGGFAVDNMVSINLGGTPLGSWTTYSTTAFYPNLHPINNGVPYSFSATPGAHQLQAVVHNGTVTQTSGNGGVTGFLFVGRIECKCAP
jgi:uncharacterized repeat protein (TIGR01451 family)